jgi:phosphatidylserine/phosphatidylglycerophosphate/cardiolipin synthase-like enzyme
MKAKNKIKIIIALLVIIVILNWSTISDFAKNNFDGIVGKATDIPEVVALPEETTVAPDVYFCPDDDCVRELMLWLDAAEDYIHCALFEVGLEELRDKLVNLSNDVEVKLITDDRYYDAVEDLDFARHDNRSGLMHNKFCVLDGKAVWTGSFNPTQRGNYHNNNNAIFYHSKNLAESYEAEFNEMWSGTFGKGDRSEHTEFVINGNDVEVYFCPEDWCANKLIYALQDAESSIYFMTFSFTHDDVGTQVLEKADAGVDIRGVFEKSQNNKYLEYPKFVNAGLDVRWDGNSANMHHKVFVIDNKTVVTGSFNPSQNGDRRNDENLLIIHDSSVAAKYAAEFEKVWEEAVESV